MCRLFVIPFVIWFGGCSLFVYDSGNFGIVGGVSGIAAKVTVSTNGLFANSHYTVSLEKKGDGSIYYSITGMDPTNTMLQYATLLQFSNQPPFPLLARVRDGSGEWGSLSSNWVPVADGSGPHPWQIANERHLSNVRFKADAAAHYVQTATIHFTSTAVWMPIGEGIANAFHGKYNGQGNSIQDLRVNRSGDYVGLFGYCSGARISNVTINNAELTVDGNRAGVLCGHAESGTIISGCVVENCQVSNINSTGNSTGGLVGYMDGGQMVKCRVNTTTVHAAFQNVGGCVGQMIGSVLVDDCTVSDGDVKAGGYVGGLVGYVPSGSVIITNCSVIGNPPHPITGTDTVGGLVGFFNGTGVYGCRVERQVQGGNNAGGLIGNLNAGFISNCIVSNIVSGGDYIGGLVGQGNNGTILQSGVLPGASVSGTNYIGGLAGWLVSVTVFESFSQAGIACFGIEGGGAVGYSQGGSLNNCYANGGLSVTGGSTFGGLIGHATSFTSIENCYAAGGIPAAAANSGRFIGVREATVTVTSCYANTNDSAVTYLTNLVGSGLTNGITGGDPDIMKTGAFYNWSIGGAAVWQIDEPVSYPYLSWQAGNIPTSP